ncbi:MAG: hypothetical protein MJE68_17610, partial [Proteobacteria bacterium]|nr:hypothetical protein [Pseudomonadota bacterium]
NVDLLGWRTFSRLKSDLIVTSATNFFIASFDNLVSVICEPSTELSFTSTACVRIKHIRFLNCTIKAFHINQLTIEDCSFELNTDKLLQLVRTSALIQRSSLANINSRNETIVTVSHGNIAFKECHFKDMIATVGLYAHNSNTNITDSKVKNLAGTFLLLESDYFCQTCTVITNCTFLMNERIVRSIGSFGSNNVSHIGDSLLWIDECHFISNTGQVVACSRGNIIISKTKFVNNLANESSLLYYMSPHFGSIRLKKVNLGRQL